MADSMEGDIQMFTDVTGLDDRTIISNALKNNGGDVGTIINQFFEDPSSFSTKYGAAWNDDLFAADRDGNVDNHRVYAPDPSTDRGVIGATPPPPNYYAPSRPPSRTNNRSPLGRMVDWQAMDASGVPGSRAQEEEDMQRALRESAQEAGIDMPAQEAGITGTTSPYFGPAQREEYDQNSWAMIPTTGNQALFTTVRPASLRKRTDGAPAFLSLDPNSTDDHQLGGLLTVLHEIPMSRNALLSSGSIAESYGYSNQWWNGKEILTPEQREKIKNQELPNTPYFEEETHRLMAFLDTTERSYGSVSCLADMIPSYGTAREEQFFEALKEKDEVQTAHMYTTAVVAPYLPKDTINSMEDVSDESSDEEEETQFGMIEVGMVDDMAVNSLYELMDCLMWSDVLGGDDIVANTKMAVFRQIGEVFSIKLKPSGFPKQIEIPEVFCPERYMESRKEEARKIQHELAIVNRQILDINLTKAQLRQWSLPNGEISNDSKKTLLEKGLEQWHRYREYQESSVQWRIMQESKFDTTKYPVYRSAPVQPNEDEQEKLEQINDVLKYLERQHVNQQKKEAILDKHLERLQRWREYLGKMLTDPNKSRPKPMSRGNYLLRGVVASKDIVFVCRRAEPDLIELDDDVKINDQWWRLHCPSAHPNQPFKAERMDFAQVSENLWKDARSPVLVYATERALNTENIPLPAALQRFVKADNEVFLQELEAEEAGGPAREMSVSDPVSPSKRKHRADSMDSVASNRASLGSDDENMMDSPMNDLPPAFNIDDDDERAPPLPRRQLPSAQPQEDMARDTPKKEPALPPRPTQASGPEMQERGGPSLFISTTGKDAKQDEHLASNDLDIGISQQQG